MDKKIKALVWEEFRVGGAIAAWCVALSAVYLTVCRLTLGQYVLRWTDDIAMPIALGAPLLIALLLILNPNQSGHLVGGFARRVLWLPVPTFAAVAVTLVSRTLFVFVAALAVFGTTHALFESGPAFTLAAAFVAMYLAAQVLDWLREPVSGLTSALIAALVCAIVLYKVYPGAVETVLGRIHLDTWGRGIALLAAFALPAYGISVAAVHAARVGLRTGIPEVWEWQWPFARASATARAAFTSPLAAQCWFDLRRSWYIVPAGTFGLMLLGFVVTLLDWLPDASKPGSEFPWRLTALFVFPPLVLSALAHGIKTRVLGLRPAQGKAGFEYLQPFTSAEYAWARVLSNAAVLLPTAVATLIVLYALVGGTILMDVLPFAYASGAASAREIAWVIVSRCVLAVLIAWPLMAIGIRGVGTLAACLTAIPFLMFGAVGNLFRFPNEMLVDLTLWFLEFVLILYCLVAYARAWHTGTVSLRAVVAWGCTWLATAWMLRAALPDDLQGQALTPLDHALGAVSCLALAALVPLPYAAIALDVTRRRHSASCVQGPAQHARAASARPLDTTRYVTRAVAVTAAVAMVWLGWPGEPAYRDYLRAKGWPATLAELDASYAAVPDDKNIAAKYLALAKQANELSGQFYSAAQKEYQAQAADKDSWETDSVNDRLLVVGGAKLPDSGPIDNEVLEMTERYWANVTSRIAPTAVQIAAEGPRPSRYPVDLRRGFAADLEYLAPLRSLARELCVDTIHWSIAGDARKAQDAALALLRLQDSLANEPLLISQLVRIAILSIGIESAECVVDRAPVTGEDLVLLQRQLAEALPPAKDTRILDVGMRGECVVGLSSIGMAFNDSLFGGAPRPPHTLGPGAVFQGLALPVSAERMAMLRYYSHTMDAAETPPNWDKNQESYYGTEMFAFAPLTTVLCGSMERAYAAEWRVRMQLDMAQAGIAAERFRRARGRLPDTLDNLVPAYIAAVPKDYYASNQPVRYLRRDDGSFVIYSVGMNGKDDGGVEHNRETNADDYVFSVHRQDNRAQL